MQCPYCYGPISRIRGLGRAQADNPDRPLYRCLLCGADFAAEPEPVSPDKAPQADRWSPQLQLVWPRLKP
ncbi:MAG: hypothetical protein ACOYZ7_17355 [Chloroflexota bacterium]